MPINRATMEGAMKRYWGNTRGPKPRQASSNDFVFSNRLGPLLGGKGWNYPFSYFWYWSIRRSDVVLHSLAFEIHT